MRILRRLNPCLLVIVFVLVNDAAQASTNGFVVPSFRGSASSEAGYWESFTVPFGTPGNPANIVGATTGAILTQDGSSAAFITGSGNIYDFSTTLQSFKVADSTPFSLGTVVLQTRSLGSELDYGSFLLNYSDNTGMHSLVPLSRVELDRGTILGASVSSLFQWNLSGLNVSEYSLSFAGASPSVSFDSMTLDTWTQFTAVPEPSTSAILGLGAWIMCRHHRNRSRRA